MSDEDILRSNQERVQLVTIDGRRYTPAACENRRIAAVSRGFELSQETAVDLIAQFYEQALELVKR